MFNILTSLLQIILIEVLTRVQPYKVSDNGVDLAPNPNFLTLMSGRFPNGMGCPEAYQQLASSCIQVR